MTPVTLSPDELNEVIKRVAPTGKEYGAARIARMLADEHSVHTVRINMRCSVGNISDQVSKGINPRINDLGLYVACVKPPRQIYNKFDQPSGSMLWSFYRDTAANDPAYSKESLPDALRRDLSALQAEFPLDYPPSLNESAEAWESALELSEFQAQISLVDGLELPHANLDLNIEAVDFGTIPDVNFDLNIEAANFDLQPDEVNHHAGN
jgi:hypothetical protein